MLRRSLPLILASAAFAISSYLTNVVLSRHLGPADYGVFGLITSLMSALNVLQTTGVPAAMAKLVSEDEERADGVLLTGIRLQGGLSLALTAILAGAAPLWARLFHERSLTGYLVVAALILPGYGVYTVFLGYWNGRHRFGRAARTIGVYAAAKLVLVVVLALGYGVVGALVGLIASTLLAAAVGGHRPRRAEDHHGRALLALGAPLVAFAGLQLLQYSVDLFTVKAVVHDRASAGFYVAAQNISVIPFLGLAAVNQVILPSVARLLANDGRRAAGEAVGQAVRYQLLIVLPTTALIVGSAPEVVHLLFGRAYAPTAPVLRILATSYVFVTLLSLFANVLAGAGRPRQSMQIAALALAVTFGLCLWTVPAFGLRGAAVSVGVGAFAGTLAGAVLARRALPWAPDVLGLVRLLLCGAAVLGLAWIPVPDVAIIGLWPLWLAVFAVLVVVTREVTPDERARVAGLLRAGRS